MKPEEIERRFSEGDCILERGSEGRELFVVRSGSVMVQCENPSVEYLLGPGEFFGENGALLSRPHSYRAVAEGETCVLALGPELIEKLCRENMEFNARLIRGLAQRAGRPREQAEPEVSAAQRALASAILARTVSGEGPAAVKGKLKDLAEASRLAIREAYECLQDMLEHRLLGLVDDQLTVLDAAQLEALTRS